ncbi:MAG: DUF1552 domain-containing protein [Myxococcales bacterium]|nr:DUF1552 domain-containing protein [Myxococcales bacterium]
MAAHGITRRRVLRGLLGGAAVTVGLPLLEIGLTDRRALAAGSAFPTRFGLFFWGNGVLPQQWIPTGEGVGDAWTLSEELAPLASVKDVITVVSGTSLKVPNTIPHYSGEAGVLSGWPVLVHNHENQTFAAPSIDQIVAQAIGGDTRFRSLEVGAYPGRGVSYNGPDNQNPPESNPAALFERLFGGGFRAPGEEGEVDPKLALRRSVLDAVGEDLRRFQRGLGVADRARLDQHLTGVRELERRIARLQEDPPQLDACARPAAPGDDFEDIDGRPQLSRRNRAICDLVTMALACDQTRVFSHVITRPINNLLHPGASAGHHQLTHDEPAPQPEVNAIVIALMAELAYFIERLRSVPEGDETLLDHCALLATSELSWGRLHSLDEFPIVIAGSANGKLRTGMHYRSPFAENTSKVMLSLIRACGVNTASYGGDSGRAEDGLGAIEA